MKKRSILATCSAMLWHGVGSAQEAPDWRLPELRSTTIAWSPCSTALVQQGALRLGDRLRCGVLTVPMDHHHPRAGNIQIAVVRVTASDPARRRGAIFFNPGGPGDTPMRYLPSLAQYWGDAYEAHPVHGTKKELAERFDLVGVVPRGLNGGTHFLCTSDTPTTDYNDIAADSTAANIQAMDRYMRETASACTANPLHRFIDTEQTAYDMEVVRRSLGEPRLNYLGYSYGAWLGSWYAAAFPESVGRMVLDSGMDWTADWDTNVTRSKIASQARFDRLVAEPAVNQRARYRLGADVATVVAHIDRLGFRVRQAWSGLWARPENLLSALTVSDWLRAEPGMGIQALLTRMQTHRFHRDATVDAAIREDSVHVAWRLYPGPYQPERFRLNDLDSVFSAIMCNDMPYPGDADHHKAKIAEMGRNLPAADGRGLQYHCAYWEGSHAVRPPLSRLAAAGSILMVHAALDPVTPLENALAAFEHTPTTHLIIADGIDEHGVFGFTDSACVEDTVGRYLLTGILPAGRQQHCEASPAAHGRSGQAFAYPGHAAAMREELAGMRAAFAR